VLIRELVDTSRAVAATTARTAKVGLMADLFSRTAPTDAAAVAAWLGGALLQRRTGVGWRSLDAAPPAAPAATLTVGAVDAAFGTLAETAGEGSRAARSTVLRDLLSAATAHEQDWLRALLLGELRQGALDSVVQSALAVASGVSPATVRRAAMMAGSTPPVAVAALSAPDPTRADAALRAITLEVGRPVQPMLASSAVDVQAAMARAAAAQGRAVVLDSKLDGIRLQVHRRGGEVLIVTRSLDDITARLPEVVEAVAGLAGGDLVLDGEGLVLDPAGRPVAFQDTAARTGSVATTSARISPFFFDLLHHDGEDLVDRPLAERLARLDGIVAPELRTPRLLTADPSEASAFADSVLAAGHEGVVVKDPDSRYEAGRRGSGWIKVKPVHTLDLVVLAVERGSGRRSGLLSNIHLGARDPATPGSFVMVGKTFKGMTDEMLRWQSRRLRELAMGDPDGWTVRVRPEQVVEIAVDGIQRSTRYPGGVALRFARVVRYRDDKQADQADTIEDVRALGR